MLGRRQDIIRAIYLRIRNAAPDSNPALQAATVVRIMNEMCGSDTLLSFELGRGYSEATDDSFMPIEAPGDLIQSYNEIVTKRKLTLMLPSKTIKNSAVYADDIVQVFVKHKIEKEVSGDHLNHYSQSIMTLKWLR